MDPYETRDQKLRSDVSRRCFVLPKLFLVFLMMWPTKIYSRTRQLSFNIKLILMLIIELTQLMYIVLNPTDISTFSLVLSTISTTLQGITKMAVLYVNSSRLRVILDQSFFTFWPSNFMGKSMQASLQATANFVQFNMICVTVTAYAFATGFCTKPLFDGVRELPFLTWFPFDWRATGVYECIYVMQVFTNVVLIVPVILGHDFIFLALATNIIAQLRLLGEILDHLGDGGDRELDILLQPLEGVQKGKRYIYEKQLLVKVIAHHHKLLFICDEMEKIFSPTIFIQLAMSTVAICVSSFLMTAVDEIETSRLAQLVSYCLGHVLQLFIICAASSELAHHGQIVSNNAYMCYWYRQKYTDIRKALLLVILRAQRAIRLTAMGVFEINYATFIAVLRLSFSFYTLLTGIVENN